MEQAPVMEPPPVQPAPTPALETTLGLNWINRVAVVTLILGAGFLFKYGVDNDWIGPGTRVTLGIIAALAALIVADRLWRRGQQVFAQGITGLGLALLYLSFYAAAPLYQLIPQGVAFGLMAATTIGAGWLALLYESQAIAVLGLIGGYLTPVALSTGENRPWILFGYLLLLNAGALVIARPRRWPLLEPLAYGATVLLYLGWCASWYTTSQRPVATIFAMAFYAQFAIARTRLLWPIVQLLSPLCVALLWERDPGALPLELLMAGGGLALAGLRGWAEAPEWTLPCFWLPVWIWAVAGPGPALGAAIRLPVFGWITAAFILFFLWAPLWGLAQRRALRATELLVLAAGPAAYFGTSYWLLDPAYHRYMGLLAAGLGGLHLLLAKLFWKTEPAEERETWPALVSIGVAFALVTLAVPMQFAGFRITIAWALEGAALAWLSSRFENRWLDLGTVAVYVLTFLRLFGVDAWIYARPTEFPALVNARFLTFAVSAVSLWLAAAWTRQRLAAGVAYVTGHVVLLWILATEVIAAVERNAISADQASIIAVAISVLMAVYAVVLVTIGVLTHAAIHRITGLVLVGLVVAKLYLIDVWELSRVFRITAFLALGVLLLAVSYLYSRFRASIEKFLRS